MFKLGIYKRTDIESPTRVFLIETGKGFIFYDNNYSSAEYGEDWIDNFNELDKDYKISRENKNLIIQNAKGAGCLKQILAYFNEDTIFTVQSAFLVSKNENSIIRISSIDAIEKIDDSQFYIEYNGNERIIQSKDFDKLKEVMLEKKIF